MFNFENLKDPQMADLFEETIASKFAAFNLLEEIIDNLTESIYEALIDWSTWQKQDLCDSWKTPRKEEKMAVSPFWTTVKSIKKS